MCVTSRTQTGNIKPSALGGLPFEEFLDATAWESETVVMLQAFSDASEIGGVLCVVGVAFGIDRAKKAHRAWGNLYGERVAHMTDMGARQGVFKGVSKDEYDDLVQGSVGIINGNASLIAVTSCDIAHVEQFAPKGTKSVAAPLLEDLVASAYNCCAHWMMYAMGGLAGNQSIQYYFETGDRYQGIARRFLAGVNKPEARPLKICYAYGTDVFAPKSEVKLLQTADFVAWEWAKNVARIKNEQPLRGSLKALMDDRLEQGTLEYRSDKRYAYHFPKEKLERFFRKYGAVMRATSHAEIASAMKG